MPATIESLRAQYLAADDEVFRTLQANNYAMTTGAYDAALRVREAARVALAMAEGRS